MARNSPEAEPLLNPDSESQQNASGQRWRPSPYWLIPVVMTSSMARGLTMAPRIQVYTDIACRALVGASTAPGIPENCGTSAVQARAAGIQATITTLMSVLSAVATGPWSRYGDIHGRKPLLFLTLSGALIMELVFILVTTGDTIFVTYAERFILLGPILDGFVGGLSAFNGVVHAYTSDCTKHGSRSRIFATLQGLVFVGLASGSWIGGMILSFFHVTSYFLFYVSVVSLVTLLAFVVFLCPESLDRNDRPREEAVPYQRTRTPSGFRKFSLSHLKRLAIRLSGALISPIAMFAPRQVPGRSRRDYNLTFLGLGLFLYLVSTGVYQIKYLYAKHIYVWSPPQLGFYMSLLWITRALNLLLLLPILISYFKPKPLPGADSVSIFAEMRFDKILARCSLAVDASANALIVLFPTSSQVSFILFSCLSSFTSGGNPSVHSLGAVCLHASGNSSEVGTLFGAMAVLSALAHIVSPSIYALTYGATVANYPKTIFCLAAGMLGTTVLLLGAINSDVEAPVAQYVPLNEEDEVLDEAIQSEEPIR